MRTMIKILLGILLLCGQALANSAVMVPPSTISLTQSVTDLTDTLSPKQRDVLMSKLNNFAQERGVHLAVLLLGSTRPESFEQYSQRAWAAWLQQYPESADNVLLVIAHQDQRARFMVGRKLQSMLTDAEQQRLLAEVLWPSFQFGNVFNGINSVVDNVLANVNLPMQVPALKQRVTDLTNTLNAEQRLVLENTLREFEQQKGAQLAVLLIPTTRPESIEQYSMRVVEQWKLGRKGVDDGVLLLIALNDRRLRIEVGRGLEGSLTDVICSRIIRENMTPEFKRGDFNAGITSGVTRIIQVVNGEKLPSPVRRDEEDNDTQSQQPKGVDPVELIFVVLGAFAVVFTGLLSNGGRGRDSWSDSSDGSSSSSSSSSGGGFSGGGGDFGGGGSSGSW